VVFDDDHMRRRYLVLIAEYARRFGVDIWAYCLMTNHVHWIVVPKSEKALARCFGGAHTRFTLAVNTERMETGHLWQNRFFSCPLDEAHLWAAVRYVERNPVRAKMVGQAEEYTWSSARRHCGLTNDSILALDFPPPGVVSDWRQWLQDEDESLSDVVRRQTQTGRPCGAPAFAERLEGLLKRVLRLQKVGRKKKPKPPEMGSLFK